MIKWLLLLPLNLGLTFINYLFCWLIALFVREDWTLPSYLSWFQTTDALMNGQGTRNYVDENNWSGGDRGFYERHKNDSRWWTSVCWLCRNPVNGFDESVCKGLVDVPVRVIGDEAMETGKANSFRIVHCGWRSLVDKPWEVYWKWKYSKKLMTRFRLGWKMSSFVENKGEQGYAQYVFVPNPFKGYDK